MNKRNKILIAVVVSVLTVGIAFGALSIAKAHSGNGFANARGSMFEGNHNGRSAAFENRSPMGYMNEGINDVAKFLGVSTDTMRTEISNGKSIADIAKENGKTVDELKSFLTKEFTVKMDALLKDGKITQDNYNTAKKYFEERLDSMINGNMGKGFNWNRRGCMNGHKGPMGFSRGGRNPISKP